jgi:hypothetical protein
MAWEQVWKKPGFFKKTAQWVFSGFLVFLVFSAFWGSLFFFGFLICLPRRESF